jgi:4-alpha-glucanotransferase
MLSRLSGVLLPVASLPGRFGIGDLGDGAFRFVDFLHDAGQRIWQVLPLSPTEASSGHSPYHSGSSFAGNPLLISPEGLAADGLLAPGELAAVPAFPEGRIAYGKAAAVKRRLLARAREGFRRGGLRREYARFCERQAGWLDDYARYAALREHFGGAPWHRWPAAVRRREPRRPSPLARRLEPAAENVKIDQFLFHRQWLRLKDYANRRGVRLFGDLPIYVPHDSADVWAARGLFRLDARDRPLAVSGVPPDYFSATGQLWGHPVYRWETHRRTRYDWWVRRIARQLELCDYLRIDHFRGLVAYWEVPAGEKTAARGRWVEAPAEDFLSELGRRFVSLPLIAEDLGDISADVREVLRRFGLPGMRVLLFGFSGEDAANPNAVHNVNERCVVYTGTHDNNTVRGWFDTEASPAEKRRLMLVAGRRIAGRQAPAELIRLAMVSPARWAIVPVQDLLALGAAARMNTPGRSRGNWSWRLTPNQLDSLPAGRLRELAATFGRV